MSIQDDYYDLSTSLSGEQLKSIGRIWFAFVDAETKEMVINGDISKDEYLAWRNNSIKMGAPLIDKGAWDHILKPHVSRKRVSTLTWPKLIKGWLIMAALFIGLPVVMFYIDRELGIF